MNRKQHTIAYREFERVVERALNLSSLEGTLKSQLSPQIDFSDLLRAAVVLAVAGMDAYFTNVYAEILIPFLKAKGPTKALIKIFEDAGLDTSFSLKLMAVDNPYRPLRRLVERNLERRTTQRIEAIDELFASLNLKNFCRDAQGIGKCPGAIETVKRLVRRRNAIAHHGDLLKKGTLRPAHSPRIRKDIQALVRFVSGAESLIHKSRSRGS